MLRTTTSSSHFQGKFLLRTLQQVIGNAPQNQFYSSSFRERISKALTEKNASPRSQSLTNPLSEAEQISAIFSGSGAPKTPQNKDLHNSSNLNKNITDLNKRVMKTWATAAKKNAHLKDPVQDMAIPYMPKEFHRRTHADGSPNRASINFDERGRPIKYPRNAPPAFRRSNPHDERHQNHVIQQITGDPKARSREMQSNELIPSDFDPFRAEEDDELAETLHLLKEAEKESLIKMREDRVYQKRTELQNPDIADEARSMGIRDLYRVTRLDTSEKMDLVNLLEKEPDSVNYEPLATFNLKQEPDFKQEDKRRKQQFGVNLAKLEKKKKIRKADFQDLQSQWRKAADAAGVNSKSRRWGNVFNHDVSAVNEEGFINMLSVVFPHYSHQTLQDIIRNMCEKIGTYDETDAKDFSQRIQRLTKRVMGDREYQQRVASAGAYHNETDDFVREFPSRDLEDEPIVHHLHEYLQQPREAKMVKILYAFKKLYKRQVTREEMLIMESLSQKYEPVVEDIKETGDYNFQEHCDLLYAILQPIIEKDFIMEDPPMKNRRKRTKVLTLRASGKGKRKASNARCVITPGTGILTINGRCYTEYFKNRSDRIMLLNVYKYANCWNRFNMDVRIRGGGTTGQSAAAQLAMVHALIAFNPQNKHMFRMQGMLTLDKRTVERKKPGQKKARKKFAWVKR